MTDDDAGSPSGDRRRRVAWGRHGTPADPAGHIIDAAVRCLVAHGLEHTSLTVIAAEAGVSRQTVYKYFATKEQIVELAVEKSVAQASDRLAAVAADNADAAGFVVELCLSALHEFSTNPAIAPMVSLLAQPDSRGRLLDAESLAAVRGYLAPIADYRPDRADALDEMSETFLRFVVSLLTFDGPSAASPESLRTYLIRVLVPAMGLD